MTAQPSDAVRPGTRSGGRGPRQRRTAIAASARGARRAGSRPSTSATTASSSSPSRSSSTSPSRRPSSSPGSNLLNLVFQNATIGIAACAVTFTIIAGNFDLSLGAIFVLSEVLGAWAAVHWGVWWAFPVAIVSGAAMGLINGLLVTKLRVNAFLATLASALTFGGIAVGVTHGGLLITPTSSVVHVPRPAPGRRHPVPRHHLRRRRDRPPARAGLHRLRPPPLRRRRQPQRGAAVGPQGRPDRDHHVRDHRRRLRPRRPDRRVDDRVGVERHERPWRLSWRCSRSPASHSAAPASSAASARSGARSSAC